MKEYDTYYRWKTGDPFSDRRGKESRIFKSLLTTGKWKRVNTGGKKVIKAHKDLKKWYENILRNHSQLKSNTDYAFTGIIYQLLEFEPFRGYVGIDIGSGVTDERAARNISILSAVLGKYEYLHRIEVFSEKNIISAPEIFFRFKSRSVKIFLFYLFNNSI